jgi:hypothetical protein
LPWWQSDIVPRARGHPARHARVPVRRASIARRGDGIPGHRQCAHRRRHVWVIVAAIVVLMCMGLGLGPGGEPLWWCFSPL